MTNLIIEDVKLIIDKFIETYNKSLGLDNYNLLEITGVNNSELKFSKILAWLFDEKAAHKCTTEFLKAFLKLLPIEIENSTITDYTVLREYRGQESTIDICVYKPKAFLIYLENKTISEEGTDQLKREHYDMIQLKEKLQIPEQMCIPVFLTPSGRKSIYDKSNKWYNISFVELTNAFKGVINNIHNSRTKMFVRDFINWYHKMGESKMRKFTELDKFLVKNHENINKLFIAADSLQSLLMDFIEDNVSQSDWWNENWDIKQYSKGQVYIINKDWIIKNEHIIWIGIEYFTIERIFNSKNPLLCPRFYVWVQGKRQELVYMLRDLLQSRKDLIGNIINKPTSSYVVKHDLDILLIEDMMNFKDIIGPKISTFFSYYAYFTEDFTNILKSYELKNN